MNSCIWILLLLFCCNGSRSASDCNCRGTVDCDNDRRYEERREERREERCEECREERREERSRCEREVCEDDDRRNNSWRDYSNFGRNDSYDCDRNDSYNRNDCCGCENN